MAKRLKAARLLAYLAVVGLGLLSVSGLGAQQTQSDVFLLHIDNIIDPNHSKYLKRGIEKAEDEGGQAVIIQIDTPGGLVSSMRKMVETIFASDIPVITFVSPQGALAGSAGTFVTAAGHIAAMAPGTNIGAATPISGGVTLQTVTGTDERGKPEFTTFLVESGTPGFTARTMHGKMMWRSSNTAELYFEDCRVPDAQRLGDVGAGSRQMLEALDSGRLGIAAMGLGCAQGAYEEALRYAQDRVQFGKPICKHQAIAFKLADMALKIELARTFLYKVCLIRDSGKPFSKEAARAKLYCSEIAREVADEAVQIHGGYGLMKEYIGERFYRDQRLLQIGEGTSEVQRIVISRHIGC